MTAPPIFNWLVQYHVVQNLAQCLHNYYDEGKILGKDRGPQTEGSDKETPHDGILVLRNGNTLIDRLVDDSRLERCDVDEPIPVEDKEGFFHFLGNREQEDGVYVFESANHQILRVCHILPKNGIKLEEKLPLDFVIEKGSRDYGDLRMHLGTKTRIALELTDTYTGVSANPIHAYQIKRSATEFGMGKVTHIDASGLVEEFFFRNTDPKAHPTEGVEGVYRRYARRGRDVERTEQIIPKIAGSDYDFSRLGKS